MNTPQHLANVARQSPTGVPFTPSESDAYAIAKSIWRYLNRVSGYQPYGWDWPTLRVMYPQIARTLKACYRVLDGAEVSL